jgi:hypothetical protein
MVTSVDYLIRVEHKIETTFEIFLQNQVEKSFIIEFNT